MKHSHLSIKHIFESLEIHNNRIYIKNVQISCDHCNKKSKQILFIIEDLKERDSLKSNSIFKKLKNRVTSNEDLKQFINKSKKKLKKYTINTTKEIHKMKKKFFSPLRIFYISFTIVLITAFAVLNYSYPIFLQKSQYIQLPKKDMKNYSIKRKGLIFGYTNYYNNKIIYKKDIVMVNKQSMLLMQNATKLWNVKQNTFIISKKQKSFSLFIKGGSYILYIKPDKKLVFQVQFSKYVKINSKGSLIYFSKINNIIKIILLQGSCEITTGFNTKKTIEKNKEYSANIAQIPVKLFSQNRKINDIYKQINQEFHKKILTKIATIQIKKGNK